MKFKRHRLNSQVIYDLKKRSFVGIGFYMIVLFVILSTDGYYLRYPLFSRRFFLLISGICLFRFLHHLVDYLAARWISEIHGIPGVPCRFKQISLYFFLAGILLTGLIWGVGFAKFILQPGEHNTHILMAICTSGLCSGGVVAFLPCLGLSISFSMAILGPGIVTMAMNRVYPSLTILFSLFFVYMVLMVVRGNREYWNALENEFLLKEKTKDIERLSQTDGLTGLYNRRYFDTAFEYEWNRAIRNKTTIAMVLCDIDHFKRVNDTFGHLAGDAYLKLTANVLKQVAKRKTDIVARYGGEEFIILMPGDSMENVLDLAERIRISMEKTALIFDRNKIKTTVSLGVAGVIPKPFEKRESLVSKADDAMYEAKNRGRNRVITHGLDKKSA